MTREDLNVKMVDLERVISAILAELNKKHGRREDHYFYIRERSARPSVVSQWRRFSIERSELHSRPLQDLSQRLYLYHATAQRDYNIHCYLSCRSESQKDSEK